jgi:hypothetical protein
MAKLTSANIFIIGLLLIGGIIAYKYIDKIPLMQQLTINVPDVELNQQDQQQQTTTCSISINKDSIDCGDSVTATIKGNPSTLCNVYTKKDADAWKFFTADVISSTGTITRTGVINDAGFYQVRAICGDCVTNIAELDVVCIPDCSDSDGGINLVSQGTCTDGINSYTDSCPLGEGNPAISESFCVDADTCSGVSTYCPAGNVCMLGRCVII